MRLIQLFSFQNRNEEEGQLMTVKRKVWSKVNFKEIRGITGLVELFHACRDIQDATCQELFSNIVSLVFIWR